MNLLNKTVRHIHCIGIGGMGVSALAEILIKRGFVVSGSDAVDSERLRYLRSLGATVFVGHAATHVIGANLVVYSSAVDVHNPEMSEAVKLGIPLIKRGHLLAEVMQLYRNVAFAGTHGKTTTTAIAAHILLKAGFDPTYFIGGIPQDAQSPVRIGGSDIFIAEVDESDASFLYLRPNIAVVTNIECDHMETYSGCEATLRDSFFKFLDAISSDGCAVVCLDDENIQKLKPMLMCPVITYGIHEEADYVILNYEQRELTGYADIKTATDAFRIELSLPGLHNMKNALAAVIVALRFDVDRASILDALKAFGGVGRRFQCHGDVVFHKKNLTVYEDYGHHPTEVRETYRAAKQAFPGRRIVLVFQPHRFTRTRDLMDEFVAVLTQVDALILLPTYAASEAIIPEATSRVLDAAIAKKGLAPFYLDDVEQLHYVLDELTHDTDIILFQGAGDVGKLAKQFVERATANHD